MEPKMKVKTFTIFVRSLGDKYFGKTVTEKVEEIKKIFDHYANFQMEHICSSIKEIEFCQSLQEYGIDPYGNFYAVIKTCSYMDVDEEWIRTNRIIEHYTLTYTPVY